MTGIQADAFSNLRWEKDGVTVNGWVFLFQHGREPDRRGDDHFTFYKLEPMMADYIAFFRSRPAFRIRSFLELGMWDGGSLALWMELLNPDRLVGVDLSDVGDSPYLKRYLDESGLHERVRTHWKVDQADRERLTELLSDHRDTLDLVIDDASHLYGPTLSSFETIFPMLQPGGLYIIEDWAWEHWPEYSGPGALWGDQRPMADLVHDLVRFAATSPAVASVSVFKDFVVVERSATGAVPVPFELSGQIVTRWVPGPSLRLRAQRLTDRIKRSVPRPVADRLRKWRPARELDVRPDPATARTDRR